MNFHYFKINNAMHSYSNLGFKFLFILEFFFDIALMNILKNNWNSPSDCVVSLFNTSCNTNIIKTQIKIHIQYMHKKWNYKCSY